MRYTLFIILIGIFLISCEYEPESIYDAGITKPTEAPLAIINLNSYTDTINLSMERLFTFSINVSQAKVYLAEVFINKSKIYSVESSAGSFTLNPNDYEDGVYELELNVYSSSGSGSLADISGAEVFLYKKNWVVYVDKASGGVDILSITPQSGRLCIVWEKYEKADFKSYKLYKKKEGTNEFHYKINYQDVTSLNDWDFIGGTCEYFISVETEYGSKEGKSLTFTDSIPRIVSVSNSSNLMKFEWTKCKYPENFYAYNLYQFSIEDNNRIAANFYENDTVGYSNLVPFGDTVRIFLETRTSGNERQSAKIVTHLGEIHKKYSNLIGTKSTDFFHQANNNYLYRYSIADNEYVDSLFIDEANLNVFASSLNAEYLAFGSSSKIRIIDPADYNQYTEYTVNEITGDESEEFVMLSIADNGLSAVCGKNSFLVYDFKTNSTIYKEDKSKSVVKISANGSYLIENGETTVLYEIIGSELNIVYTWTVPITFVEFNPLNSNELYYFNKNTNELVLFNCESQTIQKERDVAPEYDICIDPISGYIFLDNYNSDNGTKTYEVININSSLRVKYIDAFVSNKYVLHNSVLYCSNGYSLDLELD